MNHNDEFDEFFEEDIESIRQHTREQLNLTAEEVAYVKRQVRQQRQATRWIYIFSLILCALFICRVVGGVSDVLMGNEISYTVCCSVFYLIFLIPLILFLKKRLNK